MDVDAISRLTENQRAYLRLVFEHQSSKQIAQRFDISAHTVDKRIKEAMRLLDVGSRIEAARLVVEAEGWASRSLGPQSPDLAFDADPAIPGGGQRRGDPRDAILSGVRLGEDQHAFRVPARPHAFPLPFPTAGHRQNDLSVLQRLGWTIGLIIGLALATGMLLSGLTALGTLLVTLRD